MIFCDRVGSDLSGETFLLTKEGIGKGWGTGEIFCVDRIVCA